MKPQQTYTTCKALLVALLCVFYMMCIAQNNRQISIPHNKNGDTTLWYKWKLHDAQELKLKHLAYANDSFKCRLWNNESQLIELWAMNGNKIHGQVIDFTQRYKDPDKPSQTRRKVIRQTTVLNDSAASLVYKQYKNIMNLPSEDSIKGWERGLDGQTYIFETATPCFYSFKTYWSPRYNAKKLAEARQIKSFIDTMQSLLQLNTITSQFYNKLKPGAYSHDGMVLTIISKRDVLWEHKHHDDIRYLKQMDDSINRYLSNALTSLLSGVSVNNGVHRFEITFSKNHRPGRIKNMDKDFMLDYEDRKDYQKGRHTLRRLLKKVDLSWVKTNISYRKEVTYGPKEFSVSQDPKRYRR